MGIDLWWTMPMPRRFVQSVLGRLLGGTSVIVVFPEHHPSGFLSALEAECLDSYESRGLWEPLNKSPCECPEESPPMTLARAVGLPMEDGVAPTLTGLVKSDHFRYRLFSMCFDGNGTWKPWCHFLCDYAQASKVLPVTERPVFCALLSGAAARLLPATDVTLEIIHLNGYVGRMDMQQHVSYLLGDQFCSPLVRLTRIAVIASLAGSDPILARELASCDLEMLFGPGSVLIEYARSLGWTAHISPELEVEAGVSDSIDGMSCIHSAFVALRGDDREIKRRVWRGQVSEVLPHLEFQRIRLLEQSRDYLPEPPLHDGHQMVASLYDLELRSIWFFLRRARAPKPLIEKASRLRDARNALAHLEPLRASELTQLATRSG